MIEVGDVIGAKLGRQFEVGTKKRRAKLGDLSLS